MVMDTLLGPRCNTCQTQYPAGTDTSLICQHCGHVIGAGATGLVGIFDKLLEYLGELGNTNKHLDRIAKREAQRYAGLPLDQSHAQVFNVPVGGGNVIASLGKPEQGRVWQVRRLIAGGLTATTAAAGTLYFFRQGAPPTDLNMPNLVDFAGPPGSAMPVVAFYSTHQFIVRPNEHVWGVLVGGTANQQYVAAIQVEDWDESAFNASEITA